MGVVLLIDQDQTGIDVLGHAALVSFELAGFRVRTRPVALEDLIAKAPRSP